MSPSLPWSASVLIQVSTLSIWVCPEPAVSFASLWFPFEALPHFCTSSSLLTLSPHLCSHCPLYSFP